MLKLGDSYTQEERFQRVDEVIQEVILNQNIFSSLKLL